jgi:hypothetical protein
MHQRGDLIECDGLLAAVLALPGEPMPMADGKETVPDDHLAVWFGDPGARRISQGGKGGHAAVIHTVPAELCRPPSNTTALCEH